MSLIAGIFIRKPYEGWEKEWSKLLPGLLASNPKDKPETMVGRRFVFTKVDIGAFSQKAFHRGPDGSAAMLAGYPLLERGEDYGAADRGRELEEIHAALLASDTGFLKRAKGLYAAASFDPAGNRLHLVADKGAVRPLYYYHDDAMVVFASKLKVLEGIARIPKSMDTRAVTEIVGFGFPLGSRTPYRGISITRPGEALRFTETALVKEKYWRWDAVKIPKLPEQEQLALIRERLERAVMKVNCGNASTLSFLSGGLDSRCIVSLLRHRGVAVQSFNLAPEGTLDHVLGTQFAQAAGCIHVNNPMEPGTDWNLTYRMRNWLDANPLQAPQPDRPAVIWAGSGAGSSLGLHRMHDSMVELLRQGKREEAIGEYLERYDYMLPRRIYSPSAYDELKDILKQGVREELQELDSGDPAHDFRLFLILNYEKHFSDRIFEDVDGHRLELVAPFLEWDFVESVFAVPVEQCLKRRFYSKLLWAMPAVTTSVAWQTYPGHPKCPLPVPEGILDQWSEGNPYKVPNRAKRLAQADSVLKTRPFPGDILNRPFLRYAWLKQKLGMGDYSYAFTAADKYATYWKKAAGKTSLS